MISLSSTAEMLDAMRSARSVTFCAYGLWPGKVESALEEAASQGARVIVRLNGHFSERTPGMPDGNEDAVARLKALGADAATVNLGGRSVFHLKAAVCDGAAYLDDCNWRKAGDTVLRDTGAQDVRAIRAAAACKPPERGGVVLLDKTAALAAEAQMLKRERVRSVDIESEGIGTAGVYGAVKNLARRHVRVRVLISAVDKNPKHLNAASRLEQAGASVRVTPDTEKFAIVNGRRGWVGSSNATWSDSNPGQPDWGVLTKNASILRAMQSRFDARWRHAAPLAVRTDQTPKSA